MTTGHHLVLEYVKQNDEYSSFRRHSLSPDQQISPLTKVANLRPAIKEPSFSFYLIRPRSKRSLIRRDFGGIFKITQIYDRCYCEGKV